MAGVVTGFGVVTGLGVTGLGVTGSGLGVTAFSFATGPDATALLLEWDSPARAGVSFFLFFLAWAAVKDGDYCSEFIKHIDRDKLLTLHFFY